MRRLRLAIFASGNGTNARNLFEHYKQGKLGLLEPVVLLADKDCGALKHADNYGIEYKVFKTKDYPSRSAQEAAISKFLEEKQIDLMALAGYMRLLTADFVNKYASRILNIHPALLPEFPGTESIERAYAATVPFSGITVHLVDEGMDTGPILAQKKVDLKAGMSLEDFAQAMHQAEYELYPEALVKYAEEYAAKI